MYNDDKKTDEQIIEVQEEADNIYKDLMEDDHVDSLYGSREPEIGAITAESETSKKKYKEKKGKKPVNLESNYSLVMMIFWGFIILLSAIFGGYIIYEFITGPIDQFVDAVHKSNEAINSDDGYSVKLGWDAFVAFLFMMAMCFEPFLFGFFIVYALYRIIHYSRPYAKYRKATEPARLEASKAKYEKAKLKKEVKAAKAAAKK